MAKKARHCLAEVLFKEGCRRAIAGAAAGGRRLGRRPSDGARMHYQGRRWGGSHVYDASATFASYGAGPFDFTPASRARLNAAVPAAHCSFLRNLRWVVDLQLPFSPFRLVAVHAGLQTAQHAGTAEDQIAALVARDFSAGCLVAAHDPGRLESLSGRTGVKPMHPDLDGGSCLLVSGHHHCVEFSGTERGRVIVDKSGGSPTTASPLQAVVFPGHHVVSSSCKYEPLSAKLRHPVAVLFSRE